MAVNTIKLLSLGALGFAIATGAHAQNRLPGQEMTPQGKIVLKRYKKPSLKPAPVAPVSPVASETVAPEPTVAVDAPVAATTMGQPYALPNGMYAGLEVGKLKYKDSVPFYNTTGNAVSVQPRMFRGKVGYDFHPYFAVEALVGFGSKEGTASNLPTGLTTPAGSLTNANANYKLDSLLGLYIVPKYQFSENFGVYGRVGIAQVRLDSTRIQAVNAAGTTALGRSFGQRVSNGTVSDSGASFGGGISYRLADGISFNADYMSYFDKGDAQITGATLGVGYKF